MEKTIKMSLETARKLYDQNSKIGGMKFLDEVLLNNFTKGELEGNKGFEWKDSFDGNGYWIDGDSKIKMAATKVKSGNECVYKTKEQALSALAFAQLSYIVAKYNEGKSSGAVSFSIQCNNLHDDILCINEITFGSNISHMIFYTKEDAKTSLEVNRKLWLDYWMTPQI